MLYSVAANYYETSPFFADRCPAEGETSFLVYKFAVITMG
jgi:hypothetical protein